MKERFITYLGGRGNVYHAHKSQRVNPQSHFYFQPLHNQVREELIDKRCEFWPGKQTYIFISFSFFLWISNYPGSRKVPAFYDFKVSTGDFFLTPNDFFGPSQGKAHQSLKRLKVDTHEDQKAHDNETSPRENIFALERESNKTTHLSLIQVWLEILCNPLC